MQRLLLRSLPQLRFAERYAGESYTATRAPCAGRMEIIVVCEGALEYWHDHTCKTAYAGDVCCLFYRDSVTLRATRPHSQLAVCFDAEFILEDSDDATRPLVSEVLHLSREGGRIRELAEEIYRIYTLEPTQNVMLTGLFLQLLGLCSAQARQALDATTAAQEFYTRAAKDYIYRNLHGAVRQREIATALGITPEYLCAVFKQVEGMSLILFANRAKLQHVRALMEKEGLSLQDAAARYGFADPNYASRLYKKYFGESITKALKKRAE